MKQLIRANTFETNSSSTHSLILVDEETFNNFKKGNVYFVIYANKFVEEKDIPSLSAFKSEYPDFETANPYQQEEMVKDFIEEFSDGDYPELATYNGLDLCTREVYDKNGNKQIAFSYYIPG